MFRRFSLRRLKGQASLTAASPLGETEWHEAIIGNMTPRDLAHKVRKSQFPVWVNPLLENTAAGDSLLEVGSGTGELSAILGLSGRTVHLLDYSSPSIDFSQKLFEDLGLQADFYCQDVLQGIPLPSKVVDWVWSSGLLEHFSEEDILTVLKESVRVCKRGVMSLVPNANSLFYRIGKHKMEREGSWRYGRETPRFSLRELFMAAGLKNTSECSVAPYHALQFWGANCEDIKRFYDSLAPEDLACMNQGYLLFTYGET